MSSLFNAFRSDDESDGGNVKPKITQPKKTDKPASAAKPVVPAPATKKAEDPKPVTRNSAPKDKSKKPEIVEPSEVKESTTDAEKLQMRERRGAKPGDRDERGKRVFDRKDGSGRGRGLKKGGNGGHNWGSAEADAQDQAAAVTQPVLSTETPKVEANPTNDDPNANPDAAEAGGADNGEPVEEKVPEPVTFTYEEFMKKKSEKRGGAAFEQLRVSASVEEVDGKAYAKKDRAVNESETVFIKFGADKENKDGKKPGLSRATKLKAVTGEELGFTPKVDDRGERSFRGGRGGFKGAFRGRGGAGASRGRRGGPALQEPISSVSAFPSLSS